MSPARVDDVSPLWIPSSHWTHGFLTELTLDFIYLCFLLIFAAFFIDFQFSSVQFSHSVVSDSLRPDGLHAARQASLSITNSWNLFKLMPFESVMPSSHLIPCHPLLLLPSIFPSIRVFSNDSVLYIRWPKFWNFSFNISPSNEHPGLISFRMDWLDLLAVQGTSGVFSNAIVQKHQFFCPQLSL